MATISFGGMASGLPPNIVEQLMEAEKIPIKNMESQKEKQSSKLKLVTDLESKLNGIISSIGELASTRGFRDMKLTSGDENIIAGSVDPESTVTGNWNLEVQELASKASVVTNGFPDKDKTQIGVGYFKFETPEGETREVYINANNNTLTGVAAAINSAGVGVRASVINDMKDPDAPFKLLLSANGVGSENDVEYPRLYFLDGDQDIYFDEKRPAKNGKIKLDGFEFDIGDNVLKDVIPGVTLDLKQAAPGRTVSVGVKEDREVVSGKIKTFVDAMNGVLGFIQQQNQLNENSDTTQTLGGDSLLRTIEQRMRSLVQNPQYGVGSSVTRLADIGIGFNRAGLLELNQDKFNKVLANDPPAVQRFLSGDGFKTGFIPTLKREISTLTNSAFGTVGNRKRSLQDRIKQMDDRIAGKERMLQKKEENLRKKFSRLEETISRLKSQGSAVGAMGAAPPMPGMG